MSSYATLFLAPFAQSEFNQNIADQDVSVEAGNGIANTVGPITTLANQALSNDSGDGFGGLFDEAFNQNVASQHVNFEPGTGIGNIVGPVTTLASQELSNDSGDGYGGVFGEAFNQIVASQHGKVGGG